jgi:hypothetical protein
MYRRLIVADEPQVSLSAEELTLISNIIAEASDQLVEVLQQNFDEEHAPYGMAVSLALLFATSMTSGEDQQAEQANILNTVLARWKPHRLPWRLTLVPSGSVR